MEIVHPDLSFVHREAIVSCRRCHTICDCLPGQLDSASIERIDSIIRHRRRLPYGTYLYRSGSRFGSLFVLRSGCLKTVLTHRDGRFQVTGFHLPGDLVGLDGLAGGEHVCDAIALDCEVCELPFASMERLASEMPGLQRYLHRMMSSEVVREQGVMLLLGRMRADERVAVFLLNLAKRYGARGFPARCFALPMLRSDISSYLGLALETVCRVLSRFRHARLISVEDKAVEIMDFARLRAVIDAQDDDIANSHGASAGMLKKEITCQLRRPDETSGANAQGWHVSS